MAEGEFYFPEGINIRKWGGVKQSGADITPLVQNLDIALSALRDALSGDLAELAEREFTTAANAGVDVGSASTEILAANSNRKYAVIINDSDSAIYLALAAPAVAGQGIRLNASGGAYEVNWTNMYKGAINGIHNDLTDKRVTVVEGT